MRERDELGGALGGLHRGDARHAQHVALLGASRRRPGEAWRAASRCGRRRPRRGGSRAWPPTSTMWAEPLASKWVNDLRSHSGRYHKQMRSCVPAVLLLLAPCPARGPGAARPRRRRRRGPVAADGAAHRREHHARHPLPRAELPRRPGAQSTTSAPSAGASRRRAAGVRQDFEFFAHPRAHHQRLRAAGRLHRRAHRPDQRGGERVRGRLGARARGGARHPAPHRAHARPAAADAAAGAGGASPPRSCSGARAPTSRSGAAAAAAAGAAIRRSSATRATSSARPTASASRRSTPRASMCAPWRTFFEKMQRGSRLADDGSVPGYLRTHPVTTERIADAQNRAASLPYKQHLDSPEFQLVRAKLRAEQGDARDDASSYFQTRGARQALRQRGRRRATGWPPRCCARSAPRRPTPRWPRLRAAGGAGPMVESSRRAREAGPRRPRRRGRAARRGARALPELAPAALRARRGAAGGRPTAEAGTLLTDAVRLHPRDPRLHAAAGEDLRRARQARARSTSRRPRSTRCTAACRPRSSSCSSRAARATATSTSSRWSTRGSRSCAPSTRRS